MAIIVFSEKDRAQAAMGDADPGASADILIGEESADGCEGVKCGERLELMLLSDEYRAYASKHGERGPIGRHSHMVVSGNRPVTRSQYVAVHKTGTVE
jgi:hypothetical protein